MGRMSAAGHTLRAASVVEAIVASVVFMLIFIASVDIVARVAARRADTDAIAMEAALSGAIGRYGSWQEYGRHTDVFDWGGIDITVEPYGGRPDMEKVELRVRGRGGRQITHTMLVCRD